MRSVILIAGLTYCIGCQPVSRTVPPPEAVSPPPTAAPDATPYSIVAADSDIRVLVYRDGPLASLGHNHVITARETSGYVYLRPGVEGSSFELAIPVEALEVDDTASRAQAGEEFASLPSAGDIEGTRGNMLSERVLDYPRYPSISVTGRLLHADTSPVVEYAIRLKSHTTRGVVPVTVAIDDGVLTVGGTLELNHADLGLSPFSMLMGVLSVAEDLYVPFRVTAARAVGPVPAPPQR